MRNMKNIHVIFNFSPIWDDGVLGFFVKWHHGIFEVWQHFEKSDSVSWWCLFTWRTILANFVLIQFETIEPSAFLMKSPQQEEQEEDE